MSSRWGLSALPVLVSGVLLVGCASVPRNLRGSCVAEVQRSRPSEATLSEVDRQLFRHMFRGMINEKGDPPWYFTPVSSAFDQNAPPSALKAYYERKLALAVALIEMEKEAPGLFRKINEQLVAELGLRPSLLDLRLAVYRALLERGLLHVASCRADAAGYPAPVADSLPEGRMDPEGGCDWGHDKAGVTAAVSWAAATSECSRIFWYCPTGGSTKGPGGRSFGGGALKISDFGVPKLKTCVRNLRRLRRRDRNFAALYRRVVDPLAEQARRLDPADPSAVVNFMAKVYIALEGSGISRNLDSGVGPDDDAGGEEDVVPRGGIEPPAP